MKLIKFLMLIMLGVFLVGSMSACVLEKVPSGNVGVKVYLLGGKKGVDHEELGVGRYWIGINEELFLFPTFTQNYVWTKDENEGSPNDESITFQTREGMSVNADVGISYRIDPTKVNTIFQKYRRGVNEITDVFLRNMVRDAFVTAASTRAVEKVYGEGKAEIMDEVKVQVSSKVESIGIIIEELYLIGDMRLPNEVIDALNAKISATQRAQQRENEVREAEAEAMKLVAAAEGEARSIKIKAESQAEANKILADSLTSELVQYKMIDTWNGVLPTVTGGSIPMLNLESMKR